MRAITIIVLLFTNNAFAGTAGIADIPILFSIVIALILILFGVDQLRKYLRNRKLKRESEFLDDDIHFS